MQSLDGPATGPLDVEVYLDPSCPWSWSTSRWLRGVAEVRPLRLRWRSLSLLLRDGADGPEEAPAHVRAAVLEGRRQAHRLLRVFEALRAAGREDAIDPLYTAWCDVVFATWPPAGPPDVALEDLLAEAGLADWRDALDDRALDAVLEASLEEARAAAGRRPLSPTVRITDAGVGFTGPLFRPGSGPADPVAAWDAALALMGDPAFVELSRAPH